jgi:hypothetical protein
MPRARCSLRPFRMGAFVIAARGAAGRAGRVFGYPRDDVARARGANPSRSYPPGVGEPIVPARDGWDAAVALERTARSAIAEHCGEPDLGD